MKDFKKGSVRKIVLGTSSALLATLIAANGTGLANAAENQNHDNHQKMTQQKSSKNKSNTQNKATLNPNNYMDKNFDLRKRCFALVGAAEDSELNYSKNYRSVSGDLEDGRGITAGIIGFTSGTGDMKEMLDCYHKISPGNPLDGDRNNMENLKKTKLSKDWHKAFDTDHDNFVKAQNYEVKKEDMDKAVKYAKKDGLSQLGQYIYFDALVKHGLDKDGDNGPSQWGFLQIRKYAHENTKTPAQGGNKNDEIKYLKNFVGKNYDSTIDEKNKNNEDKNVTDRLDFQMQQLNKRNLDLALPLKFKMNDTPFYLDQEKLNNYSDKDLASLND